MQSVKVYVGNLAYSPSTSLKIAKRMNVNKVYFYLRALNPIKNLHVVTSQAVSWSIDWCIENWVIPTPAKLSSLSFTNMDRTYQQMVDITGDNSTYAGSRSSHLHHVFGKTEIRSRTDIKCIAKKCFHQLLSIKRKSNENFHKAFLIQHNSMYIATCGWKHCKCWNISQKV